MKVLSIGNSFSEDAHKWLYKLAVKNGVEMETLNLCCSGCSLEQHWDHIQQNDYSGYTFQPNGIDNPRKAGESVEYALKSADWDVITVQQASRFSGMPETYEPYLTNLVNYVRGICPKAEIWYHQTWAYDVDCDLECFENYEFSQQKMYDAILTTGDMVVKSVGAKRIPAGNLIQAIRTTVPEFDYPNGGLSLCRDKAHLSEDYGRFALAAVWLRTLTNIVVQADTFEDFDSVLLQKILEVVNTF